MLSYLKPGIFTLLIFLFALHVSAQKITPFSTWNGNDLSKANSAKHFKELSFQEKKIIFYINLARMDGALFAKTYLKDYMEDVRVPKNKYYRSLIALLKEQKKMLPLIPKEDLNSEAIKHAKDMGKSGKKGHRSSDSNSFTERMDRFKP